ncbi:M15 family metallopeptidase [Sporolactobacillus sp. STCC-11]|uniref:M15 family metallopeptidase n=1 Tax=Sporolactobacillus caesalpiniae TaxID=3230362 RepID=UPI003391AE45
MSIRNKDSGRIFLALQGEQLVSMSGRSKKIEIYPSYFLQGMPGTLSDLFLRESVADKLIRIAKKLPAEMHLILIDGWRSFETQSFIYNETINRFEHDGYSQQKIEEEIVKYVAFPARSLENPAPHYSGGAIDLTLADENGWINMGTNFDDFTAMANSGYFENKMGLDTMERQIRDHRRNLKKLMEKEDFVNNPTEWWHYSFGDNSWAVAKHTHQLYGGIERKK